MYLIGVSITKSDIKEKILYLLEIQSNRIKLEPNLWAFCQHSFNITNLLKGRMIAIVFKGKCQNNSNSRRKGPKKNTKKRGKSRASHVPGSKGHSFSLANSAGVFPVRTQFELRSIMGILFKVKQKKIPHSDCHWQK